MSFCVNCGKSLNGNEKFCRNCGTAVLYSKKETQSERVTVYDGEVHKCPNCGGVLESFDVNCPSCGYEIRGAKTSESLQRFYIELNNAPTVDKKTTLIINFPIPNTKEDITEFMILAVSNFNADSYISDDESEKKFFDAWIAKFEQSYKKATLLFKKDPDFEKIRELYENGREVIDEAIEKKKAKTHYLLILRNIAFGIGAVFLIAAVVADKLGGNSSFLQLIGYIILISASVTLAKRDSSIIDFAIGAGSGLFTFIVSKFLENGSMAMLCGGIVLIIIAVNFFKSIGGKNKEEEI